MKVPDTQISPVSSKSELEEFIAFPWKVYKDDPYWVPPLISERKQFLDPQKNPFFEHAKATFFVARQNGEVVGTIGAFSNYLYNEIHEDNAGFFGFFEVLEDPETAAALLKTAEDWAREAGHDQILGPMQYSTNDELGLLVEGFDDSPRILMTYNPPRYQGYIESAGYEKAKDLWAYKVGVSDLKENMPEKVSRVGEKILKRWKLSIRPVNMKDFDNEVELLLGVYNEAWEPNWAAVRMTASESDLLAEQLKPLVDPELALMIEREGKAVGFGLALPDLNQPLLKAYPRPGYPEAITLLKLLWHWKVRGKIKWVRAWGVGILPEFQGQGLESILFLKLTEAAHRKGFSLSEASWILEDNEKINRSLQMLGAEVYKTYRIYQKAL
ncbi:MAG: GNAT family N-acetyltransferase [Anaerolineae bacterium]|nr:MAG: GNAT family N-acetyltransferase [Anaerolineae bacterium]